MKELIYKFTLATQAGYQSKLIQKHVFYLSYVHTICSLKYRALKNEKDSYNGRNGDPKIKWY